MYFYKKYPSVCFENNILFKDLIIVKNYQTPQKVATIDIFLYFTYKINGAYNIVKFSFDSTLKWPLTT